jgi:uncharacterized Zn finger protein
MNPPRDAQQSRCPACQQTVETALLRPTLDGTVLLCTCPKCGVVWGAWPLPVREETP